MEFQEILKTLCDEYGISGNESTVASRIIGMIEDYADSYYVDNLGSVIAFKKAPGPRRKNPHRRPHRRGGDDRHRFRR